MTKFFFAILFLTTQLNANQKVAVCYWGLTRSTKLVYPSHFEKLFRVLEENNIEYDVFMHTWQTQSKQRVWQQELDIPIDYEEYKLLNPKYFQRDDQDQFSSQIRPQDYFTKKAYKNEVWGNPNIMLNYICALESQKRVTDMVIESKNPYDWVIYVRPDAELLDDLPINQIRNLRDRDILIPDFDHWTGYNDRFAVLTFNTAPLYGKRIHGLLNFKNMMHFHNHSYQFITSERYVKYICEIHHLNVIFVNFRFNLIRPA